MDLLKKFMVAAAAGACGIAGATEAPAQLAQASAPAVKGAAPARTAAKPVEQSPAEQVPAEVGPAMSLVIGKSTLVRLPAPIERISLGNPTIADVTMISPKELYFLGKSFGSTNVIMWRKGGATTIIDVSVGLDAAALEHRLRQLLPDEKDVRVSTSADAIVLSGVVSSALMADYVVSIAETFARTYSRTLTMPSVAGNQQAAPGTPIAVTQGIAPVSPVGDLNNRPRVLNMLRVAQPQQVMLEVQVAEISKTLLDKLGVGINGTRTNGDWRYSILSNFLTGSSGVLGASNALGTNALNLDAEKKDGLIKVLAEPNIVAISGQEASFLAGGKIYIPVSRASAVTGLATVTLEEKEFGVGLKFTPTVLDGGRINLKVAPEVSELSQTGSAFTTIGGQTSVLPSVTTRRAQTTVQLMDGQSFAIAGLIKNNATETIRRFPILGEVPVLGALFRSSEFQTDRSELMFVITPRLVKPLPANYALPTDRYVPPTREEFFLKGQLEGTPQSGGAPAPQKPAGQPQPAAAPSQGGFQLK